MSDRKYAYPSLDYANQLLAKLFEGFEGRLEAPDRMGLILSRRAFIEWEDGDRNVLSVDVDNNGDCDYRCYRRNGYTLVSFHYDSPHSDLIKDLRKLLKQETVNGDAVKAHSRAY